MPPFAASAQGSDLPPEPTWAGTSPPNPFVLVDFDQPLAPQAVLDHTRWRVRFQLKNHTVTAASCVGNRVTLAISAGSTAPPGSVVTYLGYDPLLTGLTGVPVEPFTNFPLTIS